MVYIMSFGRQPESMTAESRTRTNISVISKPKSKSLEFVNALQRNPIYEFLFWDLRGLSPNPHSCL